MNSSYFLFGRESLQSTLLQRDEAGELSRDLIKELAKTGLFKNRFNSHQAQDVVKAFRDLGHGSLDIPFSVSMVAQWIAIELIESFGSVDQKSQYLDKLKAGELIAAVCNTEVGAGTDIRAIKSKISLENELLNIDINKRGATNLGSADIMLCSAWSMQEGIKPSLEVFLIPSALGKQKCHISQLSGFKTGSTGSLMAQNSIRGNFDSIRLGPAFSGFSILKHCFNLERLLIGAVLEGVLSGVLEEAVSSLVGKTSMGKELSEYQYIQQKIIDMYSAQAVLEGLVSGICSDLTTDTSVGLARKTKLLAVLKIAIVREGTLALNAYFELGGFPSYTNQNIAQKLMRDHSALKFLGGTQEQQKIILFNELMTEMTAKQKLKADVSALIEKAKRGDPSVKESTKIS